MSIVIQMPLGDDHVCAVGRLLGSAEFKSIAAICAPSETIIGILRDAFRENVLSRILRYLFDSTEPHSLGDLFAREWFKGLPSVGFALGRGQKEIEARFNWHLTNDASTSRYLDLLIVISSGGADVVDAVIGIEAKLDASESQRQIEDYQAAIVKRYPRARKRMMLFLTPDGRSNRTGNRHSACPCFNVSYEVIARTCFALTNKFQGVAELQRTITLLSDLSQFVVRDLMKEKRQAEIDRLIKNIEADPSLAPGLAVLRDVDHRPTIRTFVYELLLPAIRRRIGGIEVEWHYPPVSQRPNEFNFLHQSIKRKLPASAEFEVYYMLYSRGRDPTVGDGFMILLMARRVGTAFSKRSLVQLDSIRGKLPRSEGQTRQWGPWNCLWASSEYRLGGLTSDEAERLSEFYVGVVKKTLPKLVKQL